jgi:long-chain fatty acid transport protein
MRKAAATIALAIVFTASPARATNGMRMIGYGPIQNSMGGASIAAPLDGATIVTNPAGMSALAPRFDLAGQAFMPTVEYTAQWQVPVPASGTATQESDRPTDVLPTVATLYRVRDDVTVGLAALGIAGAGVEYAQGAAGLYGQRTYTSYLNGRIVPAVAYRVNDKLSVGAAANIAYAQMEYEVGGGAEHSTAGAFGFGGTIGVTYKPIEMVTLGAAYETKSYYQDFEFDVAGEMQALDFDQPMIATLGAAVRPIPGLTLALDGQWINWSATNGEDLPKWSANPNDELDWNLNWDDQLVVKVGAEYQLPTVKALRVRAGYNYGAMPLDENRAVENIGFPALAEHHFTLGAGYEFGKLAVNAAFLYSPEAKIAGSNPLGQGIVAYEAKMTQTAFELGVTYGF